MLRLDVQGALIGNRAKKVASQQRKCRVRSTGCAAFICGHPKNSSPHPPERSTTNVSLKPFDVVGISALNYDYIVTGGTAEEDTEHILSKSGIYGLLAAANGGEIPDPTCGGSAYNAVHVLAELP